MKHVLFLLCVSMSRLCLHCVWIESRFAFLVYKASSAVFSIWPSFHSVSTTTQQNVLPFVVNSLYSAYFLFLGFINSAVCLI